MYSKNYISSLDLYPSIRMKGVAPSCRLKTSIWSIVAKISVRISTVIYTFLLHRQRQGICLPLNSHVGLPGIFFPCHCFSEEVVICCISNGFCHNVHTGFHHLIWLNTIEYHDTHDWFISQSGDPEEVVAFFLCIFFLVESSIFCIVATDFPHFHLPFDSCFPPLCPWKDTYLGAGCCVWPYIQKRRPPSLTSNTCPSIFESLAAPWDWHFVVPQ